MSIPAFVKKRFGNDKRNQVSSSEVSVDAQYLNESTNNKITTPFSLRNDSTSENASQSTETSLTDDKIITPPSLKYKSVNSISNDDKHGNALSKEDETLVTGLESTVGKSFRESFEDSSETSIINENETINSKHNNLSGENTQSDEGVKLSPIFRKSIIDRSVNESSKPPIEKSSTSQLSTTAMSKIALTSFINKQQQNSIDNATLQKVLELLRKIVPKKKQGILVI